MSVLSRVRDAAVEAVLAGVVVGLYEGVRLAWGSPSLGVAPVVAAVATLGAIALAVIARVLLAAIARVPVVATWVADLGAGNARRVAAAWRGALALVAFVTINCVAIWLHMWMHERYRFHEAGPVALVSACAISVVVLAVVLVALAVDRRVQPRLPATVFDDRAWWILVVAAAASLFVVPTAIVARVVPALELDYVITPAILIVALLAAMVVRPGRARAAQIGAIAVVVAAGGGTWALTRSPAAHGVIIERGIASDPVAAALRSLGDRDSDGYPGTSVGGADCDDANPTRHPGAIDMPGNSVDENCTGADASRITFALRNEARPVPPPQTRPNIVVISIDALRADHLGAYGYARPTSPALDALAARGVRFASAFTSCPSTRCAIPALHTGRYASTLSGLARDEIPTLARVLRDAGWTTAAITCCDRFATARRALAGFTTVDAAANAIRMQRAGQSNADVVIDNTLAWLQTIDPTRPYFAWLHLYEPHFPYAAPTGNTFGDDALDRYDAEIAFVDAQIGRLVDALDPRTIVVVTADHGEEFGEHGLRFHARSLYNQVVRIPLIFRVPGVAARVVTTPVSLVDAMPTVLELAGVTGPAGMNGRSLVPALRGGAAPARPVLIELAHDHQITRDMAAVVSPPWKVIWDRQANAWHLYELDDSADAHALDDHPALPELQRLLFDTLDRETGAL